jgi:hypothetical protein
MRAAPKAVSVAEAKQAPQVSLASSGSPFRDAINAYLAKHGQPISRADDGSIHTASLSGPDNAPFISYWNTEVLGPWPTVQDGFTDNQLRWLPPKLPKFNTQYDKEKFREALDKLSYAIDREGGKIITQSQALAGHSPLVGRGRETATLRLQQLATIQELLRNLVTSLFDGNNTIFDDYPSYKEELRGALPITNPRGAWTDVEMALGKFVAAMTLVQDAERHPEDQTLYNNAVSNLQPYQSALADALGGAMRWTTDSDKRLELLRKAI